MNAAISVPLPHYPREAARLWGATDVEPQLLRDTVNFVYSFEVGGRECILRLTHHSHRTLAQIYGELDWMRFLAEHEMNVATPLISHGGRFAETLPSPNGEFTAVVFERVTGHHVRAGDAREWNAELFQRWGQLTGKIHSLTKDYVVPDPAIRRPFWHEEEVLRDARRYLPPTETAALSGWERLTSWLHQLPQGREEFGLIHMDLVYSNILVDDERLTVIDFDECRYNWFAYDLAVPLYHAVMGAPPGKQERAEQLARELYPHFLRSYQQENALDPFWIEHLSEFLKLRALQLFVFWHMRFDITALSETEEWLLWQLRETIVADTPCIDTGFLECLN